MQKEFREKLFAYFKEAYFFQFERREKINGRVGVLLAIITVAANIGVKYLDELPTFDGSKMAIGFYSALVAAVGFGALTMWYLVKSLAQALTWHYLPTPTQILAFVERATARDVKDSPAQQIDTEQTSETNLIRQFAEAATHNDVSNDIKNRHLLRTTQWTIVTVLTLIACAPFFYCLKYRTRRNA